MPHALIVDECEQTRLAMRTWLLAMGYRTCELADSGAAALRTAHRRLPDLIVLADPPDYVCPATLAERLAAGRTIPVVLVRRQGDTAGLGLPEWVNAEGPFGLGDLSEVLDTVASEEAQTHRVSLARTRCAGDGLSERPTGRTGVPPTFLTTVPAKSQATV